MSSLQSILDNDFEISLSQLGIASEYFNFIYNKLRIDRSLRIPKDRLIHCGYVLGGGNFGVVSKGLLKTNDGSPPIEVAVKKPRS